MFARISSVLIFPILFIPVTNLNLEIFVAKGNGLATRMHPKLELSMHSVPLLLAVAYPGGFWLPENALSGHDFFNQGVTSLLAPTFTSHLDLRLLETPS